jgi:hypothetical protein
MKVPAAVLVVLSSLGATAVQSAPGPGDFARATAAYADMRREIATRVPGPRLSDDEGPIRAAREALADAIRSARRDARVSDVFTADTVMLIRSRLKAAMADARLRTDDLAGSPSAEDAAASCNLAVHDDFPWHLTGLIPGTFIDVLPPLPDMLEYRLVGTTLVLVDIDASLVVDVVRDALPQRPRNVLEG